MNSSRTSTFFSTEGEAACRVLKKAADRYKNELHSERHGSWTKTSEFENDVRRAWQQVILFLNTCNDTV